MDLSPNMPSDVQAIVQRHLNEKKAINNNNSTPEVDYGLQISNIYC